jgi:DNA-binding beta-propeller fold protein YncE
MRMLENLCTKRNVMLSVLVKHLAYGGGSKILREYAQDDRARGRCVLVAASLLIFISGCGTPPGMIFPPPERPIVWPAPPEVPRIRYVGQLQTSEDLKPAVSGVESLGRALFGKKPAYALLSPYGVCTDNADRVFVADSNAQFVHVFNLKTREYQQWRPANDLKRFSQPVGVAWDSANQRLLVCDSVAGSLYAFASDGKFLGTVGLGFSRPCGVAVDALRERIYVADAGLHQVLVMSLQGELLASLGGRGKMIGQFNFPTNVAVDSQGRLYVSDTLNFRIQQFTSTLRPIRQIGSKGDMPGYFSQPKGIAVDSKDHLYVVDANFESVQIFNSDGALLLYFGQEGHEPGEFWLPAGFFIDLRDRIWIADSYNRRVQVFDFLSGQRP